MEFVANDEIKSLNPDERFKYFKKHQEELLEKLIDTKLQIEEAEKFGIFVSDSEIDAAINDIKEKIIKCQIKHLMKPFRKKE